MATQTDSRRLLRDVHEISDLGLVIGVSKRRGNRLMILGDPREFDRILKIGNSQEELLKTGVMRSFNWIDRTTFRITGNNKEWEGVYTLDAEGKGSLSVKPLTS